MSVVCGGMTDSVVDLLGGQRDVSAEITPPLPDQRTSRTTGYGTTFSLIFNVWAVGQLLDRVEVPSSCLGPFRHAPGS